MRRVSWDSRHSKVRKSEPEPCFFFFSLNNIPYKHASIYLCRLLISSTTNAFIFSIVLSDLFFFFSCLSFLVPSCLNSVGITILDSYLKKITLFFFFFPFLFVLPLVKLSLSQTLLCLQTLDHTPFIAQKKKFFLFFFCWKKKERICISISFVFGPVSIYVRCFFC